MAYNLTTGTTGRTVITIADGSIDTTSTSLALPGRNYSGYGSPVDQDLVKLTEHFASSTQPSSVLTGQMWFNTTTYPGVMQICYDGSNISNPLWLYVATTTASGDLTVAGNLTVLGNSILGSASNLRISGGSPGQFLTTNGSGGLSWSSVLPSPTTVTNITTGSPTTAGTITGAWTLTPGSSFNATYADLAERFESDAPYDAGTVVELGGEREITAVKDELSERVFGVVSKRAAFVMNGGAGDDRTHPAVAIGGRVPVKVVGRVHKGDRLVSAGKGIARAASKDEASPFNTIGRALRDKSEDGLGTVEAFVSIK